MYSLTWRCKALWIALDRSSHWLAATCLLSWNQAEIKHQQDHNTKVCDTLDFVSTCCSCGLVLFKSEVLLNHRMLLLRHCDQTLIKAVFLTGFIFKLWKNEKYRLLKYTSVECGLKCVKYILVHSFYFYELFKYQSLNFSSVLQSWEANCCKY